MTNETINDILSNGRLAGAVASALLGRHDGRVDCHARDAASQLRREGLADEFLAAVEEAEAVDAIPGGAGAVVEMRSGGEARLMPLFRLLQLEGLPAGAARRSWLLRDLAASGRSQVTIDGRPVVVRLVGAQEQETGGSVHALLSPSWRSASGSPYAAGFRVGSEGEGGEHLRDPSESGPYSV